MHAHWVYVFDGTNDNRVIRGVADHFHLVFFPAQQAFINEDLVHWGCVHAGAAEVHIVFAVIRHAAAGAAKGKGRTDNRWQANVFEFFQSDAHAFVEIRVAVLFLGRGDDGRARVLKAQTIHRFAEQFPVLGHLNRVAFRTDHLYAEFVQHTHFLKRQRGVQTGLTAHRWQERIWAFFFDDLGDHIGCDRLDVGCIRQFRIGHDRRGVRVHEDDAIALFSKRLTRLCAGVVELACLADHNRTCADDHDGFDVSSFGHGGPRGSKRQESAQGGAQIVLPYKDRRARCKGFIASFAAKVFWADFN